MDTLLKQHLAGDGVILLNGKFNNQAGNVVYPQIGTFHRNGFTAFPFDSGLVITTGNVSLAAGPNNSGSASSAVSGYYTDPDLSAYNSNVVMASAVLETDFIASADWFTLNYIFASEEYCEYVNSTFNDVIVILLTGIDPVTTVTSTKNVAVIPGSVTASNPNGIPVGINTVNHGSHGPGSGPGNNPGDTTHFVCNAANTYGVQYDGYTTALSAGAIVFSCQTYHLKVAVANVGDNSLDSGVFLEEGSLYGNRDVHIGQVWDTQEYGDTLMLDDGGMDIVFSVEQPPLTSTTSIVVVPGGDAVLGADYSLTVVYGMDSTGLTSGLDSIELTLGNNSFIIPSGITEVRMRVEILPSAQVSYIGQVKTAELYLTTKNCDGYSSDIMELFRKTDTVTVHLRYLGVGIDDREQSGVRLYPNPACNYIQVDMDGEAEEVSALEITDAVGRMAKRVDVFERSVRIDISGLPAGLYFVRANTNNGRVSIPFIKQ